jgi:CubicO group peptidase (beta-lactamase class C family)
LDPAERWHYGMSTIVGKLVEKLSGQKLEDYFHEHIFAPLQMSDTSYNVPLEKAARLDGSSPATLGSVRRLLYPPNRRARNSMVGVSSREERSFSGVGL